MGQWDQWDQWDLWAKGRVDPETGLRRFSANLGPRAKGRVGPGPEIWPEID